MTSLIAWVGIDSRGETSAYLASDSRISWGDSASWDTGGKLFASSNSPEILGYCGDVTFPSQILPHVIDQIDSNLIFLKEDAIVIKTNAIFNSIKDNFSNYPVQFNKGFKILYFSRENCEMETKFQLAKISWSPKSGWNIEKVDLPKQSGLVDYIGSGSNSIYQWHKRWQNTELKGTSRSVFSAFCDSITSGEDRYTGGAPQLVGIYRKGHARRFGIIHNGKRYINGKVIEPNENLNSIEWRNCLFERCDGQTMEILSGAQRQPKPSQLM
jgi:hypothetical protein